ncbi:adenylate/guanylate cyclase domain-containing protein [Pseudoxanthobacter sp.]|uniref:adenylate/guanylate cyclase domain-containing protein n=1 Tax=Pseudoxanthobacter sp. TaxID=1925742 RepID=UPI002FE01E7C
MAGEHQYANDIVAWLVSEARFLDPAVAIEGFAHRLRATGLPIDRITTSVRVLSPTILAVGTVWRPGHAITLSTYDYVERDEGLYERSPYYVVHQTGRPLRIDIGETPDDRFGIVPELKAEGIRAYWVEPLPFVDGVLNVITFATRDPAGFPAFFAGLLARVLPAFTAVMEVFSSHRVLRGLLAAYVGEGPARQIVSGTTHRGEVTRIRAAVLFADLRGFTALSTRMPPEETAELLNRYYDLIVPAMTDRGGNILKFIGDGVLAIFSDEEQGSAGSCANALAAAERALAAASAQDFGTDEPIRFGLALHHGDVAYGNVGSGSRLDFTAVGRDVNVTARISGLCSVLERPLLVSTGFAALLPGRDFVSRGWHTVRGLADPIEVLEPAGLEAAWPRAVSGVPA